MLDFVFDATTQTLICRFEGELNSKTCADLTPLIDHTLADVAPGASAKTPSGKLKIIFDLDKAPYVSSVFLRVVLLTAKKVAQGNFSVIKACPFVKDLFTTSGLEQLLQNTSGSIESTLHESRVFQPPKAFAEQAHLKSKDAYMKEYRRSIEQPEAFWAEKAGQLLVWGKPWETVLEWKAPHASWFNGGRLNASANCLDKHLNTATANKAALIWEGEPDSGTDAGEERVLTYRQLHHQVCQFANVLKRNGVTRGDRVLIYMPMVPEAVVTMLACARIGAIHSVVFAGYSAQSVAERVKDCQAKVVVTADGGYRKGIVIQLKQNVDDAFECRDAGGAYLCESVKKVIVLHRTGKAVDIKEGRDVWWHQELRLVNADCPPEMMESEDPLFILYTSGSTGKPKGILHTTAGYLLGATLSHRCIFDIRDTDVFWCTADIGWVTGHSYVVYGPLVNGATVLMYEGAPNHPQPDRIWSIVAKHGVTIFYTAPTAIRAFMQWGNEWPAKHNLSSLRLLGTVGEPINPQAWIWYHEIIGGQRCPIVDTWWQTETGSIMISTCPGALPSKPGSAGLPFFGVHAEVVNEAGQTAPVNSGGKLIIRHPWPSMLRGVWGDPDRFQWTYWNDFPGNYFTGDGARTDADGYFWIMGRIDDVINVSGHRIGTAEVESALVSDPAVAEAAVVGRPDDIKGSGLIAFVTLKRGQQTSTELSERLRNHVGREIGAVAKPDEIRFTEALPKTRSGKIMRRLLKQVAAGAEITGDVTTLEDFGVLKRLSGEE
ncbi:MAG: acetate--CoA ligase [bacterium]